MAAQKGISTTEVTVEEVRENLAGYMRRAQLGKRFVVTLHGKPVAELGPPASGLVRPRLFGLLKGQIWMAEDFDQTPSDLIDAMEAPLTQGILR